MRLIESFEKWLEFSRLGLLESKQAKEFIQRRAAARLRKRPEDLTPQEREEAISDPAFQQILDATRDHPGHTYAPVRFHFERKIPLNAILEFAQELTTNPDLIRQLPNNLDYYANLETETRGVNRLTGWERMKDEINQIEKAKGAKWLVDRLPKKLRDQYRAAPAEEKAVIINAAYSFGQLGEKITTRFLQKIKAMSDWSLKEFSEELSRYLKGYSNLDMRNKIQAISDMEPEAGIVYVDDRYLAISIRTESAQKSICDIASAWCINRGSWDQYARGAVQLNIFDFGVPSTDPKFLIGTTIYYSGKVRTTHDINDKYIQKSDDPKENLTELGYPEELVSKVVRTMPREALIKKMVVDSKINEKSLGTVLRSVLTQDLVSDFEYDSEAYRLFSEIIKERLEKGGFSQKEVVEYFANGIVSRLGAVVFQSVASGLQPEEREAIYQKTIESYRLIDEMMKKYREIDETTPLPTDPAERAKAEQKKASRLKIRKIHDQKPEVLAILGLKPTSNEV